MSESTGQFAATLAAAVARIDTLQPDAYALSRNELGGAVSGLSPYITHGMVTLPDILARILDRQPLAIGHKFVFELGWREYFRHVWAHRGDRIFESFHPGPLPDADYARELPLDIREARSGLPAIDLAVRTLYATGYLHNHARLWLSSYVIHLRKVSWRTGADWLYGHLLDGDLASNHLSWQWVAGTSSNKPYLFNADNVARHAPPAWHSPGSVIDTSYEALDALARTAASRDPRTRSALGRDAPPPAAILPAPRPPDAESRANRGREPGVYAHPGAGDEVAVAAPWHAPSAAAVAGRDVWLVHPWALREPPPELPAAVLVIGLCVAEFHQRWPWSAARWRFVIERMSELTSQCWFAPAADAATALAHARSVGTVDDPHFDAGAFAALDLWPAPRLFPDVQPFCASFSKWWAHATRGLTGVRDLPGLVSLAALQPRGIRA